MLDFGWVGEGDEKIENFIFLYLLYLFLIFFMPIIIEEWINFLKSKLRSLYEENNNYALGKKREKKVII